jgi:predicted 2-oxoglutarate/Fe(II)-dependent dioxygenase YbiX
VLIVPRIFEPAFCRRLMAFHRNRLAEAGDAALAAEEEPGAIYPRQVRRRGVLVTQAELQVQIRGRLTMRLVPELRRAFRFEATRMERYLVACYDAAERGHFAPHRDDDAPGTAHRRFAATINLNGDSYDGGDLCFPEFGSRTYRAPAGGAVVFSCGLLHEVRPVTRGRRFACLPFLYDEDAARLRDAPRR